MQCIVLPHITASVFIKDDNTQIVSARCDLHHHWSPGRLD
jgi:hypothetical protein